MLTRRYALVGRRLGHSFSKSWFDALFLREGLEGCSYDLCEMASLDGLRRWVADEGICGFNVTVPYKRDVVALLDGMSPQAAAIGAVNCVAVGADGRLTGHNTDCAAFGQTLAALGCCPAGGSALVLGTGGAARAVGQALREKGLAFSYVSRHPEQAVDLEAISYAVARAEVQGGAVGLLVNATPVGMWPAVDESPWPWPADLWRVGMVYDLTYNPSPTLLMRQAAAQGARTADGLAMLHRQAELSWQVWNN